MSNDIKKDIKKYWRKSKPSLKVFGSVTWLLTKLGIVLTLALVIGGAGIGTGMMVGVLKDVPDFDSDTLERPFLPSYIYDINGNLITEIHDAENRIPISMTDIPDHLRDAFLAAEDNNFFHHSGFDLKGIFRAAYTNVVHPDRFEGASTLTQQVVKQVFLTPERTIRRKLQELYIALSIERQYTKEEIFEFYINNATFYDNNAWGVEAAAQTYFGKSASELSLAESAMIAGIPNSPGRFSPHPDIMEPAINRRNNVLNRMIRFGHITYEEGRAAMEEVPVLAMQATNRWPYPHYIDAVVHTYAIQALLETGLYETNADAAQAIRRDGLHIYTAMDPSIQQVVQDVMFNDDYYPPNSFVYPEGHNWEGRRYPQGAAVVMDSKTGHVLGVVGGREHNSTNRINRINSGFQPGSAIKPVIVYGPAFEHGILSPASVLDDAPTAWDDISQDYYAPENFARTFRGLVTVRGALTISDNIPAIKAFKMVRNQVSPQTTVSFARSLGLVIPDNSYAMLASAIGGSNYLVTPLQMTQAYTGFANQGKVSQPLFVTRIVDRYGMEIFSASPKSEVVMSEETAFLMTSVLRDVVTRGTARPANLSNYTVAAKTGTTDGSHDRWTVGYSRDYVFTVWMGNDNKEATVDGKRVLIDGISSNTAYTRLNQMFGAIVRGTIGDNDVPFHPAPSGVNREEVCSKSGKLPSANCPPEDLITDWFLKGNEPTEVCDLHVVRKICTDHGLLATDYCPNVVEKVFLNRPEVEPTDERWAGPVGRLPLDYNLRPPTEYCPNHGPSYTFNVTPYPGGMNLSWQTVAGSHGVIVYRQDFDSSQFVKLTDEPVYGSVWFDQFEPLPGMTYKYRITQLNDEGTEFSRHKVVEAQRTLELYLTGYASDTTVNLSWTAPSINTAGVTISSYKIYRDGTAIDETQVTSYVDETTEAGKSYVYTISVIYKLRGTDYESRKTPSITVVVPSAGNGNGNGNGNGDD